MKKRFIETGEIVGTHGVNGEVRVNPWCDDPSFLTGFRRLYTDENGEKELNITLARVQKNTVLLRIKGVDTLEKAVALRGTVLYLARRDADIPDGSYFVQDLIGCEVFDDCTGILYGEISDVFKTGANDVWTVKKDSKEYLFPAVKEFVRSVNTEKGRITILPPGGVFDDESDEI